MLDVEMKENIEQLDENYELLKENGKLLEKIGEQLSEKSDRYTISPQVPHAMETLQEIITPFEYRTKKEEILLAKKYYYKLKNKK